MPDAFATLEKNIADTIQSMSATFDTHQLILKLAQENQPAYISALYESVETSSATPFQAVHSAIGKSLKQNSLELGIQETDTGANYSSPNIFGIPSSCSRWKKLD